MKKPYTAILRAGCFYDILKRIGLNMNDGNKMLKNQRRPGSLRHLHRSNEQNRPEVEVFLLNKNVRAAV